MTNKNSCSVILNIQKDKYVDYLVVCSRANIKPMLKVVQDTFDLKQNNIIYINKEGVMYIADYASICIITYIGQYNVNVLDELCATSKYTALMIDEYRDAFESITKISCKYANTMKFYYNSIGEQ